jgi:hypothetical protein
MNVFLMVGALVATLSLGGCLNVAPGQPMDSEVGSGENASSSSALSGAALQRNIQRKYEFVNAINDDYEDSLVELRSRLEMRKITYPEYQAEKAEIAARKTQRRYMMEKDYEATLNSNRSTACHTTGRTTLCD